MIKALLIDDQNTNNQALKLKIESLEMDIEILGIYTSASLALAEIDQLKPDVVFLDVEMPEMDGFTFLERCTNRDFEAIITTAHDLYTLEALRHSALDFLLKPVVIDELERAIIRLKEKISDKSKTVQSDFQKINAKFDKIPVASNRGVVFIPVAEILYLSADSSYTTIYLKNKESYTATKSLLDYEKLLTPMGFYRIHQSSLINLIHVKEYLRGEGGTVILNDNTELDVSRRKKKEFMEYLGI